MSKYAELPWSMEDTIENLKNLKDYMKMSKYAEEVEFDFGRAIKALEEIQQYRAIGTAEVCRAAVEKQKAKKASIFGDGYADGELVFDTYECPDCGKKYEIFYEEYEYCPNCGQHMKLDWSEEE